jgi:hypothetical protein
VSAALEAEVETMAHGPIAREYWTSFTALLASHAAMRTIAQPELELRVDRAPDGATAVRSRYRRIEVLAAAGCASTGQVRVQFTVAGEVQLSPTGAALEMEMAVEQILDRVCA